MIIHFLNAVAVITIKPGINKMILKNLSPSELIEKSLSLNEGILTDTGALLITTGKRSGRSPNDRFIVDNSATSNSVDWGDVNRPFSEEKFNKLWTRVSDHLSQKDHFLSICMLERMNRTTFLLK